MVTENILVEDGVMNGAIGTVRKILFCTDVVVEGQIPNCVIVELDYYDGPAFPNLPPKHVPIFPCKNWSNGKRSEKKHFRIQLPLILAWAFTIYKAQV